MKIPVDTHYHTTVVVRSLEEAARRYAAFFGIRRWQVVTHASPRLTGGAFGNMPLGEYRTATGSNDAGGLTFQLVEPGVGPGIFADFLASRGEGIASFCLSRLDRGDFQDLCAWLAGEGIAVAQQESLAEGIDVFFLDTRRALGGFYLEFQVAVDASQWPETAADEEWDLVEAIQRPPGLEFINQLAGISHIGVVVNDVDRAVATYARLFGVPRWRGMHWHTEPGWLEEPTYNGHPVEHSYSMGRADVGKNELGIGIGFEVCQPEEGPSHFKEDFLIPNGEGVHHLALPFPMKDVYDWVEFNKWLDEGLEVPTCMSAWLREHTRLSVWKDTTPLLGFVIEYGIQAGRGRAADFWYDFSEELGMTKA